MPERDYADLISKLLLKAESTTSAEEAETFFAKAQELMTQYSIDRAMVEAARLRAGEPADPIVREEFVNVGIYRYPLGNLTLYVLRTNDIEVVKLTPPNWREIDGRVYKETEIHIGVGHKSDLDRARALQTSLMLQAMTAEGRWWRENEPLYRGAKRGGHYQRRQFLLSFASGVYAKLVEAAEKGRDAAAEEHGVESVALVLRDKGMAVQKAFGEFFPNTRKSKRSLKGGDAWAASHGYEAGQRADVGTVGISDRASGKKQLSK